MPKPKYAKTVVLSENTLRWLKDQSKRLEMPISQVIRAVIRCAMEGKKWQE